MSCLSSLSSDKEKGRSQSSAKGTERHEKLTENHGNVWEGVNQFVFHLVGDFRDFGVLLLVDQPAEEFLLLHQVTLVDVWNSTLEEDHGWELLDTPLAGFVVVVDLHEGNVVLVALVVDVFELSEDLLGLLGVFVVCGWNENREK